MILVMQSTLELSNSSERKKEAKREEQIILNQICLSMELSGDSQALPLSDNHLTVQRMPYWGVSFTQQVSPFLCRYRSMALEADLTLMLKFCDASLGMSHLCIH